MASFDEFLEQFEERPRVYPPELPVLDEPCDRRWRLVSLFDVIVGAGRSIRYFCLLAYAFFFWGGLATLLALIIALTIMEATG